MIDNAIQVLNTGISVLSHNTSSAAIALPTTSTGAKPLYVRVAALWTGIHFKLGGVDVVATENDPIITSTPQIFKVGGFTHFAIIHPLELQVLNITPVEV